MHLFVVLPHINQNQPQSLFSLVFPGFNCCCDAAPAAVLEPVLGWMATLFPEWPSWIMSPDSYFPANFDDEEQFGPLISMWIYRLKSFKLTYRVVPRSVQPNAVKTAVFVSFPWVLAKRRPKARAVTCYVFERLFLSIRNK
jgi:hypothetical protein